MRPYLFSKVTKVLMMALALAFAIPGMSQAGDRGGDRNRHYSNGHHRPDAYRPRQRAIAGISADRYLPRNRHVRLSGVRAERRQFDRGFDRRFSGDRRFSQTNRFSENRRPNRSVVVREHRGQYNDYWEPIYGGDEFPSKAPGGTYFGSLSAWNEPGNGTYFRSDRYDNGYYGNSGGVYENDGVSGTYGARTPKIIIVNPSSTGRACSWESGVCVIRR